MDPLSIAASVAGLAGLAIQVAPTLREYFSDVKNAQEDASRYATEVYALAEVCERLRVFLKTETTNGFDTAESVLSRTAVSCDGCLRELARLLASQDPKKHGPVAWKSKMKWPTYKKQVEQIVSRLSRYTQLFQFALTVEGCAVLSRTPEDVTTLLKLQHEASTKLHEITRDISALKVSAESHRTSADEMASMLEAIQSFVDPSQQLSEIQESIGHIQRQLTDSQEIELLDWLSPMQGRGRHDEVSSRRTPGTGQWVFTTPAFRGWMDESSPSKFLWLVGAPGCGKSTLISLVIDQLKTSHSHPDTAIAYYYCDYRTQTAEPLTLALRCILRLLVERLGSMPMVLQRLFENCRREGRPPLPLELEDIIRNVSSSMTRCFVLVDAMDEFSIERPAHTVEFIKLLDSLAAAGVQVLVTSRTPPGPSLVSSHIIENHSAAKADIRSYVAHTLHADDSMLDILDNQLEDDISRTIVEQANGMFLLAVLHLQTIRGQATRSGVRKALSELNSDLSDAYDKTFEAIKYQSQSRQEIAFKTLMWVSSSYRPLNSLELRHALATQIEDTDLDVDNIPPLRLILRACCGLVAADDTSNDQSEVRLVHHTLFQYLDERQDEWMSRAHPTIARTCLSYLLFKSLRVPDAPDTQSTKCQGTATVKHVKENFFVLKQFARDHWGFHARLSHPESYAQLAMELLTDTKRLQVLYPENREITGLHIAAGFGLRRIMRRLIQSGSRINAKDFNEQTPLHTAASMDQTGTAIFLLDNGALPNTWSLAWETPLYIAVERENIELIKALVEHGARVDISCKDNWTPLHKAADIGNLEIVKYLINEGSSTVVSSARGLTALHRAAGRGHVSVIRYLVEEAGAQTSIGTVDNWTPLHGAASSGKTDAVSLLLDLGSDIHSCGWDGRTPLHRAVQGGYADTVEMLISRGADVMIADGNGDLPLHIAAREGHGTIINLLLGRDLKQLSCSNHEGWTPLHEAQLSGFHAAEKHLRERAQLVSGETIDTSSEESTLTSAIQTDDVETVKFILEKADPDKDNDISSYDAQGRTCLHQAFHAEAYNVASFLLNYGANIHAQTETGGWQAIHYAALSGNAQAVKMCLDHGADIEARTQRDQTPLHHACRNGNEETVQLLLDNNVNVDAADDRDKRPLHVAAAAGHGAVVSMLVNSGKMDVRFLSENWEAFQAAAAQRGHHEVVEMIRGFRYSFYSDFVFNANISQL